MYFTCSSSTNTFHLRLYVKAACSIINKPVLTSFMSTAPTGLNQKFNHVPMEKEGSQKDKSYSVEYWEDMQCRLEYMEAQVSVMFKLFINSNRRKNNIQNMYLNIVFDSGRRSSSCACTKAFVTTRTA